MSEENNYSAFERVSPAKVIPVRGVRSFAFDGTHLTVEGYAFFEGMLEENPHKVEHTLLVVQHTKADNTGNESGETAVVDVDKIVFEAPTLPSNANSYIADMKQSFNSFLNTQETNELLNEEDKQSLLEQFSANYSYRAVVDLGTISSGSPLVQGEYELAIRLKQFKNGNWIAHEFSLGSIESLQSDFVYTTKMRKYAEKVVTTYSLVAKQVRGEQTVALRSTKLSEVNPADLIVRDDVIATESKQVSRIKKAIFRASYMVFKTFLPIQKNKVSFLSDSRIDLTGNFEYIYEEMQQRDEPFDTSFYFKLTNNEPKSVSEYVSLAKAIATSRYVLLDDFYPLVYALSIRKGVDLVQVWHAVGAFKTFGFSRVGMAGGPKLTSRNHRNYTKALVSSQNVAANYAEGFGIDKNRIQPLGAPRTDLFFDEEKQQQIKANLYDQLPFLKDKKVILFAPTFRGPGQQTAYYPFDWIDYQDIYENLAEQGFVFLFKIHPFVKNSPAIPYEYSDFFYDVSDYREINDLLLISDVMITDYSSVVFEYSLLKRKTIFFAPDLSEYMASRNFYSDYLDFIPGPHVVDSKHLVEELVNYTGVDEERIDAFLHYYYDDLDGQASKRFVDALENEFTAEEVDVMRDEQYSDDGKWIPKWGKR